MFFLTLTAALLSSAQATPTAAAQDGGDYVEFETIRSRVHVQPDGGAETTVDIAVLLRTGAAVTELGQIGLPYVDGLGEVAFQAVSVRKADGRVVEMPSLETEDVNPFGASGLPVPADLRLRKANVPGLEPGDRLSYRIVLRQKPLSPGRIFGEMKFAPLVSAPLHVYELDLPRGVPIRVRLREGLGASWEEVAGPADRVVRRLSVRLSPPPSQGDEGLRPAELKAWVEPDVVFTNFESWDAVGRWWWALARERLRPDAAVKAEAQRLVAGKTTPAEKLAALHAFVSARVRYLSVGFGIGRMQPRAAADVLSSRYGDCKDKHALLEALAAGVGLDVRPVLIHSLREDVTGDVPSPQQFDHMISLARVGPDPAGWLWMDGTNAFAPAGYLPPNLRDKGALVIEADGKAAVVRTPADPPFTPRTEVEGKGSLDGKGVLRARLRWTFRSDREVGMRTLFAMTPRDRHAEAVKSSMARHWKDGKVSNVAVSDPADVATPFQVDFDVERAAPDPRTDREWGVWIPTPDLWLPEAGKDTEKGKAAEFEVREFSVRMAVELPEGATARAPLSVSLDRPFGQFRSNYAADGRTLRLERTLKLFRSAVTAAETGAYESFRKALETDRELEFFVAPLAAAAAGAGSLQAAGKAAYEEKNYDRAVELLRNATAADPKLKGAWNDLGRALRDKGDKQEAIKAFEKQIEADPFDDVAYAERAHMLIGLGRWDEAEKDLLKQIEVAPFRAWSHARMGDRRVGQMRFKEAAEHYGRAATIEPKVADHWLDLAWAHVYDGQSDAARPALAQARTLELQDWEQISAARAYASIGDAATGSEMAAAVWPAIARRLASVTPADLDDGDRYWAGQAAAAWQVIGAGALAAGELAKAERYLQAAWRTSFQPEAAWSLGLLRERQDRPAEAARWLVAASSLSGATWRLPKGHAARVAAAAKQSPPDPRDNLVMSERVVPLSDRPTEEFDEEVLVLAGADGAVESVKNVTRKAPAAFDRQLRGLGRLKLPVRAPDGEPVKLVLRGLLTCFKLSTCALVLDIPGTSSILDSKR